MANNLSFEHFTSKLESQPLTLSSTLIYRFLSCYHCIKNTWFNFKL